MRRRPALAAALAVAAAVLTGCSDTSTTSTASSSDSPSATGSPSASPTGSTGEPTGESTDMPSGSPGAATSYQPRPVPDHLPRVRIEAANLHYAYLGRNAASTPEEQAVVSAWMSYWQGAADTYYLQRATRLFESVARADARSAVVDYMRSLKPKDHRVMGYSVENVTSVKVAGSTARVRDCTKSFTFVVDRESEPVSRVVPYYDTTGTLSKTHGHWRVVGLRDTSMSRSCLR